MPFVSQAQRRKWNELLLEGVITQEQYDEMDKDTPDELPMHAGHRPMVRRGPNKYNRYVKEVDIDE